MADSSNAASIGGAGRTSNSSCRWVISGGTGALGAMSACWLVASGVKHIALLGRTGLAGTAATASKVDPASVLAAATDAGSWASAVALLKCDAAVAADLDKILQTASSSQLRLPLAGVLHAGGVLADATLPNQSLAGLWTVFAPKAAGTGHLATSAAATLQPLSAVKLFSSVAAALGTGGQANYAAANALLDDAASCMQQGGLPGMAVNWGAWAGAGMAAHAGETGWPLSMGYPWQCAAGPDYFMPDRLPPPDSHSTHSRAGLERLERLGFGAIRPGAGMTVMSALLRSVGTRSTGGSTAPPALVASVFFWDRLKNDSHLFSELKQLPTASGIAAEASTAADSTASATNGAAMASAAHTAEAISATVTAAIVAVLGDDVGADTPLVGAGLDSLGEPASAVAAWFEAAVLQAVHLAFALLTHLMTSCRCGGAAKRDWSPRGL